jgi:methionine-rich copper-binding protein CopC
MTHPHTLARRRARRTLGLLAVAAGVVFGAMPAAAHASLTDSNPTDGTTLAEPPAEITLEFSEPVQGNFVQVAVLDSDDSHHEDGEPIVAGSTVTQAVDGLAGGEYRISFRVGSSDGHPVTGVLTFTVAAPADEEAEPTQPPPQTQPTQQGPPSEQAPEQAGTPKPTEQPAAADDEESGSAQRWLAAGAAVAAAAVLLFALLRRPGARGSRTESDTGPQ